MSKFNLDKYKRSIQLVKDLEHLIPKLGAQISEYEKYKHYAPIKDLLYCLKDQKTILEIHLNKEKRIKESKGKE